MDVRPIKQSDFEELAEIYTVAYNSLNIGENWDKESAVDLLKYFYKEQPDLFFTAELDGKIAGAIVAMVRPWWDGNHLIEGEIFVHPDYQKRGVGVMLIKTLFTEAKQKYNAISWDTFTHTIYENPLAWYKDLGFEEIKHWQMITGNIDKVLGNIKAKP